MKRLLAMICALLLPVCAGAETIARQIGAPESYQAEYYSNTGRTKITVDAAVYVPDVENIATYAVTVRDFTAEEGLRLARLLHADADWQENPLPTALVDDEYTNGSGYHRVSTRWHVSLRRPNMGYISLMNDYTQGLFGLQPSERKLEYKWNDPDTNLFFYANGSFGDAATVNKTLKGQTLTVNEAAAKADAFMAQIAPEYQRRLSFGTEGEKGDGKVYKTLAYCFVYTREVGGVPITYEYTNVEASKDTAMAPAPGTESILLTIHGDRIFNFIWKNPCAIGNVLQPSAELLPFEQIMSVFGTIAPLSVQSTETDKALKNSYSNGMYIKEIRLGYMPVLCKDNPNQWELRPVWDFMGSRILPRETYDHVGSSLLTIDAIDGTVIDREYGY